MSLERTVQAHTCVRVDRCAWQEDGSETCSGLQGQYLVTPSASWLLACLISAPTHDPGCRACLGCSLPFFIKRSACPSSTNHSAHHLLQYCVRSLCAPRRSF